MSCDINLMPSEVLYNTFSYLDAKSLQKVGQVCKRFNVLVVNLDDLWKPHCLSHLENEPFRNSWRERFKIIKNMHTGQCTISKTFSVTPPTFINGIPYTIIAGDKDIFRNLETGKEVVIDAKEYFKNPIRSKIIEDSKIIYSDLERIVCFDILTGKFEKEFQIADFIDPILKEITIYDIITVKNQKMKFWNLLTGDLKSEINWSNIMNQLPMGNLKIMHMKNYLLLLIVPYFRTLLDYLSENDFIQCYVVNKKDGSFTKNPFAALSKSSIICCEEKTLVIWKKNQIQLYEDKGKDFEYSQIIILPFTMGDKKVIKVYKNWLFFWTHSKLYAYDTCAKAYSFMINLDLLPSISIYEGKLVCNVKNEKDESISINYDFTKPLIQLETPK